MNISGKTLLLFLIISAAVLNGCKSGELTRPSCCLIIPPAITLTGEKTAVESQIIGDYRELEKDAWVISSVQTSVQRGEGAAPAVGSDIIMLRAMKIRELHEPKLRRYKDEGAVGEKNNGFIVYRSTEKYERDRDLKDILNTLIREENNARMIIFERSLAGPENEKPAENDISAFGRIFAEEQRALAVKNDWIQESSGSWVRK